MNRPLRTRTAPASCPCSRPCSEVGANAAIMKGGESFRFKRGEVIWSQNDHADSVVVICTGAAKLTREWPGSREIIMELLFRGDLAGEEAALPTGTRATSLVALQAGRAVRLSGAKLQRMLRDDPSLAHTLMAKSIARQENFAHRIDEMVQGPVENRLARVLVRISEKVGLKDSRGVFLPVRLSRGDLADMVSCRVETTIRIMTRWQRQGVVETQREGLVLRSAETLEAAAAMSA